MTDARKARAEVNALVGELLLRLAESDVRDLEVRRSGIRVRVSRAALPQGAASVRAASAAAATAAVPQAAPVAATAAGPAPLQITAPLTGIFYRSASPQTPPFVQVGAVVAEGDVVALIEAMKLFNEIRSNKSGVVRKVLAENGQLVRGHQPLFELEAT